MVDTKDIAKSNEGFDQLIEDVGSDKMMKVSSYKDLIKSNSPRNNTTRSSKGSVSDQDVFFIYGASDKSGSLTIGYNDATFLKSLTEDELESFDDSEQIVYIPITRYKSNEGEGLPEIRDLSTAFNHAATKDLFKQMFGKTKVYAIKNSMVAKIKETHTLIPFNHFFKEKLKTVAKVKFDSVTCYNDLVEFCKKNFEDRDNDNHSWYREGDIVHQFACHMLNIFGLDYRKFIKNTDMVKVIDTFLIMEYFALTVHSHKFDIRLFKSDEYHNHISSLLSEIGIDGMDSENIRSVNVTYNQLIGTIQSTMYTKNNHQEYIDLIKPTDKSKISLMKKTDLRRIVKAEVDKNPMVKYIMGTHRLDGNLRSLAGGNPISNLSNDNRYAYNSTKDWLSDMSQEMVDLFKIQLSSLIK
jgi:hypothetical protein